MRKNYVSTCSVVGLWERVDSGTGLWSLVIPKLWKWEGGSERSQSSNH